MICFMIIILFHTTLNQTVLKYVNLISISVFPCILNQYFEKSIHPAAYFQPHTQSEVSTGMISKWTLLSISLLCLSGRMRGQKDNGKNSNSIIHFS